MIGTTKILKFVILRKGTVYELWENNRKLYECYTEKAVCDEIKRIRFNGQI